MLAQSREFLPGLCAVGRAKYRRVLHPGVYSIRIFERWLQMPHSLELPGVRLPVIPLMGAGNPVVHEFVAHWLPGLTAVIGALDQLPEPAARLRCIQSIRIDG